MGKEVFLNRALFICILIFCFEMVLATDTQLDIDNPPPYLYNSIPNYSWGGNFTNALNLSNYFLSFTNRPLTYSSSEVDNLTISINNTNSSGMVSFYSDSSFVGIRNVTFDASDGNFNTSSNLVFLFVGMDSEAPRWSGVQKNREVVYQNDLVRFSADWADNYSLKNYTLSINQGAGYFQYSDNFTGFSNTSVIYRQISAYAGQTVSWFFCASDTSYNTNCTDVKSFLVSTRVVVPGPTPEEEEESTLQQSVSEIIKREVNKFITSASSFLVSLKQGSAQTKIFEIINTGNTELNFSLSIRGIDEIAVLSNDVFVLSPGETQKVAIDFFSKKTTLPGQYFGDVWINSYINKSIPITLNINPLESDAEISIEIPEEYKSVKPGKIVVGTVTLKNLKDVIDEGVDLHLSLMDFYGNVYDYSDEKINLTSTISLTRNFTISENMPLGDYLLHARLSTTDELLSIDSDSFEVGTTFQFLAFLKTSFIFLLIILLAFILVFLIMRYKVLQKRKERLNLYIDSLKLKKLMQNQKFDDAVDLFIQMKSNYGGTLTKEVLENREALKEEMKNLVDSFDLEKKLGIFDKKNVNDNNFAGKNPKQSNINKEKIADSKDKKESGANEK